MGNFANKRMLIFGEKFNFYICFFFWLLFLFFKILLIVSRNMYLRSHCLFLFSWQLNLHLHFPKPHFYVTHISYIINTNAAYALGRVLWIKSRFDRIRKCDEKGTFKYRIYSSFWSQTCWRVVCDSFHLVWLSKFISL